MRMRALVTLPLAAVVLFGLMGGTSSAKVINKVGAIDVPRTTVLTVVPLSPDSAQYSGFVSLAPAQIRVLAKRSLTPAKKSAGASGRKKPLLILPSEEKRREAKRQAEELCTGFTRLTFLEVFHLSNPPFLLGRVFPQLTYNFTSNRPPPGDLVRAQQVGTDFGGAIAVRTGSFRWTVSCSPVEMTVPAP